MKKMIKTMKKNYMYGVALLLVVISVILGAFLHKKSEDYIIQVENQYNLAFYELVDYVQDVENYLAKSMISSTPEQGVQNLTYVWRNANLAQVYLAQLPISNSELANTAKFLNQVSEFSYALSRKNIDGEPLSEEDLNNIKELHDYCIELRNTLDQLAQDMSNRKNKLGRAY